MHSNFIIDIDIQEEGEKAENIISQIREIINEHRGLPLNKTLFNSVVSKIEVKCNYFDKHNFPPMFCLMTMYGVALIDKKQEKVLLAQQVIMSQNYTLTRIKEIADESIATTTIKDQIFKVF